MADAGRDPRERAARLVRRGFMPRWRSGADLLIFPKLSWPDESAAPGQLRKPSLAMIETAAGVLAARQIACEVAVA